MTMTTSITSTTATAIPEKLLKRPYRSQQHHQLTTRFFVVVVAIVGIILAVATNDVVHAKSFDEAKLAQVRMNCRQETKPQPNDAEYKLITENKLLNAETTAASTPKSLQCYCFCYLNATGIFTGNAPSTEFLSKTLPDLIKPSTKLNANVLIEKCGKPTGADDCEKAFNFVHCVAKEAKIYLY